MTISRAHLIYLLGVSLLICLTTKQLFAQQTVTSQNQIWLGFMTSTMLNNKYSIWNDIHLVPAGFFLLRTGLTRDMKPFNVTAGMRMDGFRLVMKTKI